ncbi:uncharacterized protein N7498_002246 [Penicillium cinerascens]|uniref:Uncharacterized protein n=1 Tax=Penicillium cinerascens TaxID=70096 RepID=A0A9W9TB17_9EURO|nr:uncharacterized protein N7498_002246 [Penicillium cinerascens]KAJ5215839.1 hypothetical protein N7498_002246 [Penicillium cinerascens]
MRLEKILEDSKQILNTMRTLIEKGETERLKENKSEWLYGGQTFTEMVTSLEQGIKEELKSQNIYVDGCSMRHFSKAVKITLSNPAARLLIIPINGTSTLFPGGELPTDTSCYIDE